MRRPPDAPRDRERRLLAATEVDRNVVVTAGAGTGKTSLLVERLLVAIGKGRTTLDAVAAITFTEKAAGELRHRLAAGLDALASLASGAEGARPPGEALRAFEHLVRVAGVAAATVAERAHAAIPRLDRAAVTTIHGFCAEILRAHPIEVGLPPGFRVERGPRADRIAGETWAEFVRDELGPAGARPEIWSRALAVATMSELGGLGRDLARGAVPASLLASPYAASDGPLRDEAAALAEAIRNPRSRAAELTEKPRTWLEEAASVLEALALSGPDAARRVRESSGRLRGGPGEMRGKTLPADDRARLKEIAREAWAIVSGLDALDEGGVEAAVEAVRPFARRLREAFARTGLVDFDSLLVGARDLLRDFPAVRERVKARFDMLLIDEFQDTDPVQYEVVLFLAEAKGGGATDPWATRLAPGRLFIVGDAKQSIYRFRGADYAAYRRAVAHVVGQDGIAVSLTSSFRSVPEVIDPVNDLFLPSTSSSWAPSAVLPDYEPVAAERGPAGAPAVEIWTTAASREGASERRRAEGAALASGIAAIVAGTPLRFKDVLVLFRSFSELATYVRALREAHVPFVVAGGRDYHERTEIVQAIAVLRAVDDPDDPVARLAFLRSPAGGVPDDEIARFAESREAWSTAPQPDPVRCPRVATALAALAALREEVAPLPVDLRIRSVLERSGLLHLSALGFDGAQRVANLEKLATDASALARDGRLTLREAIDALAERPRGEEEGESPLADETADAVRIMTVHKAKGLEAPVVVIADAAAGRKGGDSEPALRARVVRTGGVESIAVAGPGVVNAAALAATLEDRRHEAAEDLRLLYVALTRARDRLIVLGGGRRPEPWTRALAPWGYEPATAHGDGEALAAGRVLHRVLAPAPRRAPAAAGAEPGALAAVAAYERACALTEETAWSFLSPSRYEDRLPRDDDAPRAPLLDSPLARAVGSLVHARLERFEGDRAGLQGDLVEHARGPAADNEVDPRLVADGARAVLDAFAASPLAARFREIEVVGREVPILLRKGETAAWHGTIDLLYRDRDGTLVVADYKTDAEIEAALERHAPQLRVYAEAVRRSAPGARVRAELWMVRHGEVLPVHLETSG